MESNANQSGPPMATAEECHEPPADDVKQRCWDQREALPEEPRCVICGRYGEYICDETDDDVCSLECKHIVLSRAAAKSRQPPAVVPPPVRLPAMDECYYVRDGDVQTPKTQSLTNDQTQLLRKKLEINLKGGGGVVVPAPIMSFGACNIPRKLLENIESAGYEMPTPVQMQGIPAALAGRSLLVSADTGSGKTGAFLVPLISHCVARSLSGQQNPLAMVLTPTRELCIQVEEQAKLLGKGLPFKTALVVGGDPMPGQLHRIQQGVEVIIATPGRLIDLLTKNDIELGGISLLVLDEVDCMLQRGFDEQVMQIFRALAQPQVLMYSATFTKEVEKIAGKLAKDVVNISVGRVNRPNRAVKQVPIWVESKKKKQKLFDILLSKQHFTPPAVVFVGSRLGADLLSEAITVATGIKVVSIHGEKPMKERREILKSFLLGEIPLIVATGVLGRGVDLLDVRQVIIFDMPNSIKEYVHQIGRASKLGEEGRAIVFINEDDKKMFPELIDVLKSSGAPIPRELTYSRYAVPSFGVSKGPKKRKYRG